MLRFILLFIFITIFKFGFSQFYSREDSIISCFDRSKAVFAGIINDIHELKSNTLSENEYIVEFQLTEIYKGKRREKVLTVNDIDIVENLKVKDEYLVYTDKKKQNDYYNIFRILNVKDSATVDEIRILYGYLKTKLLKKVKSPVPHYKLVIKGCGC